MATKKKTVTSRTRAAARRLAMKCNNWLRRAEEQKAHATEMKKRAQHA
jgi:hypothetical protein